MDSVKSETARGSGGLKAALQLASPGSWIASLAPALFALLFCALRGYPVGLIRGLLLLLACVLLQSAVNTFNEYFDFVKGTDSVDDCLERSDATLVYGDADPKNAFLLGFVYLAAGAVFGLLACLGRGLLPLLIGAIGMLVVWSYSGGPKPLSYLPLGELVSGLTMGGAIPLGIAACADGALHPEILFFSLPLILGIALIMMSNNGCDIEKDRRAGRRTLPLLLGRDRSLRLYRTLCGIWIGMLCLFPIWLTGFVGLLSPLLLFLLGKAVISRLFSLRLLPGERIQQMKSVVGVNILGAFAMIAALAAKLILVALHG